jgi:hypothetical protein
MRQARDGNPAENLSSAEMNSLADPLFELVLKQNAHVTNLVELEQLIQPSPDDCHTFVVDERIADPTRGQSRRTVLTFTGSNKGQILSPNVMLSVFFDSESFSDTPTDIEAWGWDNHRSRYNYYKMDNSGMPDGRLSWKFRVSSEGADLLNASDRKNTCLACHINGAPIMKELSFPWNNWHSFKSQATYLTASSTPEKRWPVADNQRLKGSRLKGAESLEVDGILPAITQFNNRRVNSVLAKRDTDGNIAVDSNNLVQVVEGRRILKALFFTTEYNIISADQKSGLHPFPSISTKGPDEPVFLPNTFFLNANLIGGGTPASYKGLGIKRAQQFRDVAKITPAEYRLLIQESGVQLGGRKPGDSDFAWLVPEPSHVDNDLVDRLMRRGFITPQFVAAVLAIDLETPILSTNRESLFQFVPDRFRFKPIDPSTDAPDFSRHPDELTQKVIVALENSHPTTGSPAAEFLELLNNEDPVKLLEQRIEAYRSRVAKALGNDQTRGAELKRLLQVAILRRNAVLQNNVLRTINETGNRLFPMP